MFDFEVLNEKTPIVSCHKINSSFAKMSNSFERNWIYHKDFDITEFIGESLSEIRKIRSVHYFPGCFDDKNKTLYSGRSYKEKCIRTCSFDFMDENKKYFSSLSLGNLTRAKDDHLQFLLDNCKDDKNREAFINEMLELMALDVFMEQRDRKNNTVYEKSCDGVLRLAPVFDYEHSFFEKEDYVGPYLYESDLGTFYCEEDYWRLIDRYPHFRTILCSYLNVNLEKEIRKMFEERSFSIEGFDLDFYKRCDERNHKRLEKILN